jgi:hypothetical protein
MVSVSFTGLNSSLPRGSLSSRNWLSSRKERYGSTNLPNVNRPTDSNMMRSVVLSGALHFWRFGFAGSADCADVCPYASCSSLDQLNFELTWRFASRTPWTTQFTLPPSPPDQLSLKALSVSVIPPTISYVQGPGVGRSPARAAALESIGRSARHRKRVARSMEVLPDEDGRARVSQRRGS